MKLEDQQSRQSLVSSFERVPASRRREEPRTRRTGHERTARGHAPRAVAHSAPGTTITDPVEHDDRKMLAVPPARKGRKPTGRELVTAGKPRCGALTNRGDDSDPAERTWWKIARGPAAGYCQRRDRGTPRAGLTPARSGAAPVGRTRSATLDISGSTACLYASSSASYSLKAGVGLLQLRRGLPDRCVLTNHSGADTAGLSRISACIRRAYSSTLCAAPGDTACKYAVCRSRDALRTAACASGVRSSRLRNSASGRATAQPCSCSCGTYS